MNLSQRIEAFVKLGQKISNTSIEDKQELFSRVYNENNWFTEENIIKSMNGICSFLEKENLEKWLEKYDVINHDSKKVGVIMAGNIPLVGFHDFLSILISGHSLMMKPSTQDNALMSFVVNTLIEIEPEFKSKIEIVERLNDADVFIGTGSDNSAKYFRYYFGKKPHIIRQNRSSIAVLSGDETTQAMEALGKDIFTYYGLGCRNVSKLLVPKGYDFIPLLDALKSYESVGDHHKYRNNYDYNKSIYLVNSEPHLDTGFLLVRESSDAVSPISVLYYQQYGTETELNEMLKVNQEKTQCIVGHNYIPFGKAQMPELWDYADGVDTMEFLTKL
jgi:hypothetical protein